MDTRETEAEAPEAPEVGQRTKPHLSLNPTGIGRFLIKKWYIAVVVVALLSLFVLYPYLPTKSHMEELSLQTIAKTELLIENKQYDDAGAFLDDFILSHKDSPHYVRALFLKADLLIKRAEHNNAVNNSTAKQIMEIVKSARGLGYDVRALDEATIRLARLLRKSGLLSEAVDLYRSLPDEKADFGIKLELAEIYGIALCPESKIRSARSQAVGQGARKSPDAEIVEDHERRAYEYLDAILSGASDKEKSSARFLKVKILLHQLREDDAMALLDEMVKQPLLPSERDATLVERGRIFLRRNRSDKALADFQAAADSSTKTNAVELNDRARYFIAEAYRRQGDRRVIPMYMSLINVGSTYAAPAYIALGRFYAAGREEDPIPSLMAGLSGIRSISTLEECDFDIEAFHKEIRAMWNALEGEDRLRFLKVADELVRVFPEEMPYIEDRAMIFESVARALAEKAAAMEEAQPLESQGLRNKADNNYLDAAMQYVAIAELKGIGTEAKVHAHQRAAELFGAGKYFSRSADQYSIVAALAPAGKHLANFMQASMLKAGDILSSQDSSHPGALEIFEKCILTDYPADDLSRRAMIEKGHVLMLLGKYEQAASTFNLIVDDHEGKYGLTPDAEEWRRALYRKGECAFNAAMKRKREQRSDASAFFLQARASLTEFLERYSQPVPHQLCLLAAYDIALSFSEEREYEKAYDYFSRAVSFGRPNEKTFSPEDAAAYKTSFFSMGDVLYSLGRYKEAVACYDEASRKYSSSKDRIWGMIGLARSHAKLANKAEAQASLEDARNLLKENEAAFNEAPKGFGANFWNDAIREIASRIQ